MSSFTQGMQMGMQAYRDADNARRQSVLDERAEVEFGQKQEDVKRARGLQAKNDAAVQSIEALDGGVYSGAQANFGANNGAAEQGPMPQQNIQPIGEGLKPRKATAMEFNQAYKKEALTRGDMKSVQALQEQGKNIEYDERYAAAIKEWDGLSDKDRAEAIRKASYDQNIGGSGNWIPGKGKTAAYMNYMPPNGDPLQLSANEARHMYALAGVMEVDPARARKESEMFSANVRQVTREAFAAITEGVKENNNTARDQDRSDIERQKLGLMRDNAARAGSREPKQTRAEAMQEQVEAYAQIMMQATPGLPLPQARQNAANILLKDPNVREPARPPLPPGMFYGRGENADKMYREGRNGVEEVRLPGQSATDARLAQIASGGVDLFPAEPEKAGLSRRAPPNVPSPVRPASSSGRNYLPEPKPAPPAPSTRSSSPLRY